MIKEEKKFEINLDWVEVKMINKWTSNVTENVKRAKEANPSFMIS